VTKTKRIRAPKVSDRQLLETLIRRPLITRRELAFEVGMSLSGVQHRITELFAAGLIREGDRKTAVVTDKGWIMLAAWKRVEGMV
jgi:predicted transcriptional regulator